MVLDVVHNHLGPSGNYLGMFGPYFTDRHHTPWGAAINLDAPGSRQVRDFLLGSARQWLVEMGLDGLRLDAVHELRDDSERHFLAELADAVTAWEEETGRPLTLIAESDRNQPGTVTPAARGGLGMDMQWADDVHHGVHAWITGERSGYYADFGSAEVLATVLERIFLHAGTWSSFRRQVWGTPVEPDSADYDAHSFVTFLQDHDQVGNRAAGDRIHHGIAPGAQAAASALILLGPGTPMLFQGEEWTASTPFTYSTDHEEELGALVSAGRREEFAAMGWAAQVPDPQLRSTFESSHPALAGAGAAGARGDAPVVPHPDRTAARAGGSARSRAGGHRRRGARGGHGAAASRGAGRARPSGSRPAHGGAARRGGARVLRRGDVRRRRDARSGRAGSRGAPTCPLTQEAASAAPGRSSAPPSFVIEARRDRERRYFLRYPLRSSSSEKRSSRTPGAEAPARETSAGTSRS